MTDLFESQLTEALHRRADERTSAAPSLADLHHRARSAPAEPTAPDPGRRPRLFLAAAFAAVIAVAGLGVWRVLAETETSPRVDAADEVDETVDGAPSPDGTDGTDGTDEVGSAPIPVDPDDPLTWPVDEGGSERFRKGPNGEIATFEGEIIFDTVVFFLDGLFLGRWDEGEASWERPTAPPGSGIETGAGRTVSEDLTEVIESPRGVAVDGVCLVPGQETWGLEGTEFDGLHVYPDRLDLADLLPRAVVEISARPTDVAAVESALSGTDLEPSITRVLQFDADGDGVDEVLIEATSVDSRDDITDGEDEYSLLLLNRVGVDGEVETIELHESIESIDLFRHTIAAVADINGDGSFELVTRYDSFESEGGSVWNLDGTPSEVIQGGCGA